MDDPVRAVCLDDADENRCIDRVQRHLLRAAVHSLKRRTTLRGKAVLDHGCGSGRWITFLRELGLDYHGTDIAESMLALAQRRHPDAALRPVDAGHLPYPDGHFDLVWSVAVIHHNPYDAQEHMIADMVRVLHPGGSAIWLEGLGLHTVPHTNYFPRPLLEWQEVAARHGLTLTWHRGATYMVLRPLASRAAPWLQPDQLDRWQRLLTRLDAVVDPYLQALLPPRYHTRAVMLFQKPH